MAFAVIKTGGKQYRVSEGDKFLSEKIDAPVGQEFDIKDILLYTNDKNQTKIGNPSIEGMKVTARVIEHTHGDKKIIFKFKNKTRYTRKKGHTQPLSRIEILKITP